jgi:hypothetical protein
MSKSRSGSSPPFDDRLWAYAPLGCSITPFDVDRAENRSGALISEDNHTITPVVKYGHDPVSEQNIRAHPTFGSKMVQMERGRAVHGRRRLYEHYTKNFPFRITCSPSNQMSKSRPTQSMCVFEIQSAPVCSA